MKRLLVISNHNPANWSEEQKAGWDEIKYISFPNVPPNKTTEEIINDEVEKICEMIQDFVAECDKNDDLSYINLQGEFSVCAWVFQIFANDNVRFTFPTTERVVEEVKKPDGSIEKKTIFRFVMWR